MTGFTVKLYMITLKDLLKEPKKFFINYSDNSKVVNPMGFLIMSCMISTLIFLYSTSFTSPVITGSLYFINALGMTFIASIITYIILSVILKGSIEFQKCFSIFAFSTGVTIIGAGVPFLLWFAEIWKWGLVATGMKNSLKLNNTTIFLIIITSLISLYFGFTFLISFLTFLKTSLI